MNKKKNKYNPRYETRSSLRVIGIDNDCKWAEHSAECQASFFGATVEVFDLEKRKVICTKFPPELKEA